MSGSVRVKGVYPKVYTYLNQIFNDTPPSRTYWFHVCLEVWQKVFNLFVLSCICAYSFRSTVQHKFYKTWLEKVQLICLKVPTNLGPKQAKVTCTIVKTILASLTSWWIHCQKCFVQSGQLSNFAFDSPLGKISLTARRKVHSEKTITPLPNVLIIYNDKSFAGLVRHMQSVGSDCSNLELFLVFFCQAKNCLFSLNTEYEKARNLR